ncbi:Abi family protein [Devosia elaeis]|nr:Abi family protein [Devosia elaeis]
MVITDQVKAEECLSRIGYYRLSAYWYPFRESQLVMQAGHQFEVVGDNFKAGTTFSSCLELYVFDKKLRMLVMDGLERIEVAVRTDIALLLGQHDRNAHRLGTLLHGNFAKKVNVNTGLTGHQKWLDKQDSLFRDSKEEFVKHFKSRYPQSHLPIWMAVELWDFGMLSHFFGGMKVADKDQIAALYQVTDGQTLESWLRSLNVIRNICAHHSRLWNKPLAITPKWPKGAAARQTG